MTDQTKTNQPQHLSDADFQATLTKVGAKPILVDFYADWCGPCKMAEPIIEKLADEYKDQVVIAKLDVDASHDTAVKYGVMSIPTVIMFKNGEEIDRKVGFPGEQGYRNMVTKALN